MPCCTTVQAPSFATTKPCRYRSKSSCTKALSTLATRRLVRASAAPSTPVRSPNCISSAGVLREWRPRPPQTVIPRSRSRPARPPEPHQWTRLGLADGVRADAAQSAGRALRAGPDRFEKGLHPVDDLEILGAETELEVAPSFALRAQPGAGEVGAPDVDPGAVDQHGLEMDARAHLQRQPSPRQAPPLLERSAERPRGQLRVEDAQLHAPSRQLREESEHGSESAFALDLHVLQVRSGNQHGFARMRELFADHFAVEIASLQQRRGDGAHDAAMPRRGPRATLLIAGVRRSADSVLRRPGVAGVAGIAAP